MRRCSRESHRTQASGSRVGFPIRKGPRGGDVRGRGPSSVYFLHPSFAPSHPHPCSALVSEKISWSLILTQLKREFVPNPSSGLRVLHLSVRAAEITMPDTSWHCYLLGTRALRSHLSGKFVMPITFPIKRDAAQHCLSIIYSLIQHIFIFNTNKVNLMFYK